MSSYWYVRRQQRRTARQLLASAINEQKYKKPTSARIPAGVASFITATTHHAQFTFEMNGKSYSAWIKAPMADKKEAIELWGIRLLENNPILVAREALKQNIRECPKCHMQFYDVYRVSFQKGCLKYCPRCGTDIEKYLEKMVKNE